MDEAIFIKVYNFLESHNLLKDAPKYWWSSAGTFEVVIGAILTQNTLWSNVEKSLQNLEGFLDLASFLKLEEERLKALIRPSGFYNQKAPRLLQLAHNIKQDYKTFDNFQKNVTREWLLAQKGIGKESADAILCYACFQPVMVVDAYTKRLLNKYGIRYKEYDIYKKSIESAVDSNWEKISYKYKADKHLFYARFHGMIVEFMKRQTSVNAKKV